jgi:hypothetical protein
MPQNMQKKPKEVASLDMDDAAVEPTEEQADTPETRDEAMYQKAIKYLERGMDEKKIADQLVLQGLARPVAVEIARKVWKENLATRSQNVTILLGAGAFFIVLGIALLALSFSNNGALPVLSPSYLLILFGIFLAVRAYFNRREIR